MPRAVKRYSQSHVFHVCVSVARIVKKSQKDITLQRRERRLRQNRHIKPEEQRYGFIACGNVQEHIPQYREDVCSYQTPITTDRHVKT